MKNVSSGKDCARAMPYFPSDPPTWTTVFLPSNAQGNPRARYSGPWPLEDAKEDTAPAKRFALAGCAYNYSRTDLSVLWARLDPRITIH